MLKNIYRILILIAVFIGALFYFSRDIKEVVFVKKNTTKMEDATFPLLTIKSGDSRINLLHGYSSNLNANSLREALTPLNSDQSFEILINEEKYVIKKLNYELREYVGNKLIESGSVSVFDQVDEEKSAKIKLNTKLSNKEYAVKITLVTSKSNKMYYYNTVKVIDQAYLKEKLDFVMEFHNTLKEKESANQLIKYMEPDPEVENSTLSYVNIHSSFELVSWGNLKPKFLTQVIPTIKEIYADTALVELNYYISAEVSGATEYYRVRETYRVRYTPDRMYLLNYERNMDALFDVNLASVAKNELKLGITSDHTVPYLSSDDQKKLAFVRNNELWFYNFDENKMTNVFSFRQLKSDYTRDLYNEHDIRIMNMDAEGNLFFMVYGYMNRGQYEGRVAIILYQYVCAENRIQEMVYVPLEEPYQMLKENIGNFAYLNAKDVFYIHIYDNIYAYNLITKKLKTVAEDIHKNHIVVLKDLNYIAWQENFDPRKSKKINIMNMETEEITTIDAKSGNNILLMGNVDSNLIYGFVKEKNIISDKDGKLISPLHTLQIATVDKKILKKYEKPGYYISKVKVNDNVVELSRVQKQRKDGEDVYAPASKDYIMNQVRGGVEVVNVTKRVTDKVLTEYYLSLPQNFTMKSKPKVTKTKSTIISHDPTIRLPILEKKQNYYYPYVSGGIKGAYEDASDAIKIANDGFGVVLDKKQHLVWERGIKDTMSTISYFDTIKWNASSKDTVENCISLMLRYQGVIKSKEQLNTKGSSAYEVLQKHSKYLPVALTNIELEEAFYYICKGRPVMAYTDHNDAVLIYGYDAFNIKIIDPKTNTKKKIGIGDSTKLFDKAGNIFMSYLQ